MRRSLWLVFVLAGCGGLGPNRDTVARVGDAELTVPRLTEWLVAWEGRPAEVDFVTQLVRHWVHVNLFAERMAAGDSLLDSAIVLSTMWPDVHEFLIADLIDQRFAERMPFDSAQVDSIYDEGVHRVLWYYLYRVNPEMSPAEREQQRTLAEQLRRRLVQGGAWGEIAERNERGLIQLRGGGNLELFRPGETVPEFESVAAVLEPGELSEIVPTSFGYHVIYRPRLAEVRGEFIRWTKRNLVSEFDSLYGYRLVDESEFALRRGALARVREVAEHPLRHLDGDEEVVRYREGALTTGDIVRWLQYLPVDMNVQLVEANDEGVTEILRDMVRRDLLWREVEGAGLRLADSVYTWLEGRYRGVLASLWQGVDLSPSSLARAGVDVPARRDAARARIDRYLDAVTTGRTGLARFHPFLASWLRENGDWTIRTAGIERATAEVRRIRGSP